MKVNWVIVAALLLVGCGSDEDNAKAVAEKVIARTLKDPDSAKFSGLYTVEKPSDDPKIRWIATCGQVNAKNSFGAYAGATRFVVLQAFVPSMNVQDTSFAELQKSDRRATVESRQTGKLETVFEAVYWNKYCVDAVHPPSYSGERSSGF